MLGDDAPITTIGVLTLIVMQAVQIITNQLTVSNRRHLEERDRAWRIEDEQRREDLFVKKLDHAGDEAGRAYKEANNVNVKIANMQKEISAVIKLVNTKAEATDAEKVKGADL